MLFSQGKDFVTSLPGNGARKMLFLSLYLRLKKYSVKAYESKIKMGKRVTSTFGKGN